MRTAAGGAGVGVGGGAGADLKLISSIEKKELRDVPINSVTLHPNRRRLLLQTRNHQLLALDTRLQHFSARYQGHRVGEYHVRATYSPDGRFVVAAIINKHDAVDVETKRREVRAAPIDGYSSQ